MLKLLPLAEKVWSYCEKNGISGKTVTVKIKYSDFTQATRSRTVLHPFSAMPDVLDAARELLAGVYPFRRSVRLLGVTVSSLTNDPRASPRQQLDLGL